MPDDPRAGAPTATPSTRPPSTYYFFLNQRLRAVRRPARPRGGQLRRSTGRRSPASTRARCSPAAPARARASPATTRRLDTDRLPVRRPGRAAGPRARPGADPPGRRRGRAGHRLGQPGRRLASRDRGLRRDARRRSGSTPDAADRRRRLLRDDQRPAHRGADRVRHLVRGLPAPARLLLPRRRRLDPADQQPEPRQRRRPARSTPRSTACERVDDLDSVAADWSRLDRYLVSPPQSYVVPFGPQAGRDVLLRADGPRQRGLPPAVPQRLLELAAEGGRVGQICLIRAKVRRR